MGRHLYPAEHAIPDHESDSQKQNRGGEDASRGSLRDEHGQKQGNREDENQGHQGVLESSNSRAGPETGVPDAPVEAGILLHQAG